MKRYLFDYYQDSSGAWRWRLREAGGRKRILADSAEGYSKKANAIRAIEQVIELIRSDAWEIQ